MIRMWRPAVPRQLGAALSWCGPRSPIDKMTARRDMTLSHISSTWPRPTLQMRARRIVPAREDATVSTLRRCRDAPN